jgi:hypothetical protein
MRENKRVWTLNCNPHARQMLRNIRLKYKSNVSRRSVCVKLIRSNGRKEKILGSNATAPIYDSTELYLGFLRSTFLATDQPTLRLFSIPESFAYRYKLSARLQIMVRRI